MKTPSRVLLLFVAAAVVAAACDDLSRGALPGGTPGIPARPMTKTLRVQAAYDDTNLYLRVRFDADEGIRQEYFHYTDGAWLREGGGFRDYAAALAGDAARGDVDRVSAGSETVLGVAISDRHALAAVRDFDKFGCFLACHERQDAMPNWREGDGEFPMALFPGFGGFADAWIWRADRTALAGIADDESLGVAGLVPDAGTAPFAALELDTAGNPPFAFSAAETGAAAFAWDDVRSGSAPYAFDDGTLPAVPDAVSFGSALALGYVPAEGDAVPAQILAAPDGSRADVTAESSWSAGSWDVTLVRRLSTTDATHDVQFTDGGVYDIALSLHSENADERDHYVTLPLAVGLSTSGDLVATKTPGVPDFTDETTFPVKDVGAVLPGVTSFDFLVGSLATRDGQPRTWDVKHGGRVEVAESLRHCGECHRIRASDPVPTYRDAGALESLVLRRGGVYDPTPFFEAEP